jgi:nitrosocyanin
MLLISALLYVTPAAAELRKFNIYTVEASGVKMWVPSTLVVKKGDDVEITAMTKVPSNDSMVHGFTIEDMKIAEVADDKGKTIKFKAAKPGIFNFRCHLHPAHQGGQLVVLK